MKKTKLILLLVIIFICSNYAFSEEYSKGSEFVYVYTSLEINTFPESSDVSWKKGFIANWEYLGKSPIKFSIYQKFSKKRFLENWHKDNNVFYKLPTLSWTPDFKKAFDENLEYYGDQLISDFDISINIPLKAEKTNYETEVKNFELDPQNYDLSFFKQKTINNSNKIKIKLKPLQETRDNNFHLIKTIKVTTDPPDVAVYANQEYLGKTPLQTSLIWNNESQRIELRFEKNGWITNRRMITPQDRKIHVVMRKRW